MYIHKIKLEKAFAKRRLGNSLTWDVSYDGKVVSLFHRSGRKYHIKQSPAFVCVDIRGNKPQIHPIKKPRDPRRALLWEYGYRKKDELEAKPSALEFENQYIYDLDENGEWTGGAAQSYVRSSAHIFIGYVSEAIHHQGFVRQWWMHKDCTLEEIQEALKGQAVLREWYAQEGSGY